MLADIEALLRQKIGLAPTSIGSSAIATAVSRRMADCGIADMQTYMARLQTSPLELEELIENTIVPETWFFRDREPFVFLSRYVMSEWLPNHASKVLRVLSIPCATGEEPYSIAIALVEAGLSSKNFYIDAVDISKRSLLKAQRAIYDSYSFRGDYLALPYGQGFDLRERYFEQTMDGYQLHESIRRKVNFSHGNLLDPHFLLYKLPYDAIFCRNLLIYFDNAAKEQTVQILERLLDPKGLLFVGHSETGQLFASKFVPVRHPFVFAYRKAESSNNSKLSLASTQKSLATDKRQFIKDNRNPPSRPQMLGKEKEVVRQRTTNKGQTTTGNKPTVLQTARIAANRGQLNEAIALCEIYLSQNRFSAEAYVLLGEVHQAAGNEEQAEQCFNKAIYLDPNYYEALMHLALIQEHRGELASAAIIRQRIQRIVTRIKDE